jgi:hypothetical protein
VINGFRERWVCNGIERVDRAPIEEPDIFNAVSTRDLSFANAVLLTLVNLGHLVNGFVPGASETTGWAGMQ